MEWEFCCADLVDSRIAFLKQSNASIGPGQLAKGSPSRYLVTLQAASERHDSAGGSECPRERQADPSVAQRGKPVVFKPVVGSL